MYKYLFKTLFSLLIDTQKWGLLGHMGILVLTSWGTFILFSITLEAFPQSHQPWQVSNSLPPHQQLLFCFFFLFYFIFFIFFRVAILMDASWCLGYRSDCLSSMVSDAGAAACVHVCHWRTMFEKCPSKALSCSLMGYWIFCCCLVVGIFKIYSGYYVSYETYDLQMFSPISLVTFPIYWWCPSVNKSF